MFGGEFVELVKEIVDREGDPILIAIENLHSGMNDFNFNAPMHDDEAANAYAAASFGEPRRIIQEWNSPALSLEGAIAALKLAKKADDEGDYSMVGPMLAAALGYFEA